MDQDLIDSIYERYCKERNPKVDDADLQALESQLNTELPPEFRKFIGKYNGGWFSDPVIVLNDVRLKQDRLTTLYGINDPVEACILGRPESIALFDDNDPLQVLPIGYTIMGNLLYMLIGGDEDGNIGMKLAGCDEYIPIGEDINALFERIK
jgi:hypothetical protein